jgi:hypothetical protein
MASYKILVGKPEGKRQFIRPCHRWDDNIRLDLKTISWKHVGWIQLAQ